MTEELFSNSETCSLSDPLTSKTLSSIENPFDDPYILSEESEILTIKTDVLRPNILNRKSSFYPEADAPVRKSNLQVKKIFENQVLNCDGIKVAITIPDTSLIAGSLLHGNIWLSYEGAKNVETGVWIKEMFLDFYGILNFKGHSEPFYSISEKYSFCNLKTSALILSKAASASIGNKGLFLKCSCKVGFPFSFIVPLDIGPGTYHSSKLELLYYISSTLTLTSLDQNIRCTRCTIPKRVITSMHNNIAELYNPISCIKSLPYLSLEEAKTTLEVHTDRSLFFSGQIIDFTICYTHNHHRRIHNIKARLLETHIFHPNTQNHYGGYCMNQAEETFASCGYLKRYQKTKTKTRAKSTWKIANKSVYSDLAPTLKNTIHAQIKIPEFCRSVNLKDQLKIDYTLEVCFSAFFKPRYVIQSLFKFTR